MNSSLKPAHIDATGCDIAVEVLREYGTLRLGVTGLSMFPAVWPGDILTVERTAMGDISKGEIVLFRRGRRLCAHRVVDVASTQKEFRLLTRGDTMGTPDKAVSNDEFLGRVTALTRNGKSIDAGKNPRLLDRAIATLIKHSEIATRVVIGVHSVRAASRVRSKVEFE